LGNSSLPFLSKTLIYSTKTKVVFPWFYKNLGPADSGSPSAKNLWKSSKASHEHHGNSKKDASPHRTKTHYLKILRQRCLRSKTIQRLVLEALATKNRLTEKEALELGEKNKGRNVAGAKRKGII
jgi:hypothetical protein